MYKKVSDAALLKVAYDDDLFRKELRRQSGEAWSQLLEALKAGPKHPRAKEAVAWIKQIADESRDEIATMIAKQDFGEYPIGVFGFDQICSVWAPEFDSHGPFLSHDDAVNFIKSEWSEFLISDEVTLHRFPRSRSMDKAVKTRARRAAKNAPLVRHLLDSHEYSRVGVDLYLRHPKRHSGIRGPISGSQLAESLVSQIGTISEELKGQIQATEWVDLICKIDFVVDQRAKRHQEEISKANTELTEDVVRFFDEYLEGRDNTDASLLDAAARAWVWRGFDLTEDHPDYEDRAGAIQRYGRQRYQEALNAYRNATQTSTPKKRTRA